MGEVFEKYHTISQGEKQMKFPTKQKFHSFTISITTHTDVARCDTDQKRGKQPHKNQHVSMLRGAVQSKNIHFGLLASS